MKIIEWWQKITVPRYTRWAYIAPALACFLVVGHGMEDAGWKGTIPYAILLFVSLAQLVRPTVIGWFICIIPFLVYICLLIIVIPRVVIDEWVIFLLIALIPTLALLWARPRIAKNKRDNFEQNVRDKGISQG